jgi:hypothetical protein
LEFKKVVGFQRVWACVDSTYKIWVVLDNKWLGA